MSLPFPFLFSLAIACPTNESNFSVPGSKKVGNILTTLSSVACNSNSSHRQNTCFLLRGDNRKIPSSIIKLTSQGFWEICGTLCIGSRYDSSWPGSLKSKIQSCLLPQTQFVVVEQGLKKIAVKIPSGLGEWEKHSYLPVAILISW